METVHLVRSPENAAHLARSLAQHRAPATSRSGTFRMTRRLAWTGEAWSDYLLITFHRFQGSASKTGTRSAKQNPSRSTTSPGTTGTGWRNIGPATTHV